jgi:transposase-like protein
MSSVLSAPRFHNEQSAYDYVESLLWPDGPICPHCGSSGDKIGRLSGKTTRAGLRKCYACRKPFTVKIGTIFEDSHAPLHLWLQAVHLICSSKKGISTRQLQRTLGCGMKTAWFMGHRIRAMMERKSDMFAPPLGGKGKTLEADVTYVGRKPGTKVGRGGAGHMNPVFALVERDGEARSFHVPNITGNTLASKLSFHASRQSRFMTDEAPVFKELGWNFASHGSVKHSANEYVRGDAHTNTIEGFFSILKRGVYGTYQHVSEAHLHRYLSEFDFRYNNREKVGIGDVERADRALIGAKGKRLTYETTSRGRRTETRAS